MGWSTWGWLRTWEHEIVFIIWFYKDVMTSERLTFLGWYTLILATAWLFLLLLLNTRRFPPTKRIKNIRIQTPLCGFSTVILIIQATSCAKVDDEWSTILIFPLCYVCVINMHSTPICLLFPRVERKKKKHLICLSI